MQHMDPFSDLDVAALDEEDLVTTRGGLGFLATLATGLPVADLVEDPRVGLDGGVADGAAGGFLPSLGLLDHELLLAGADLRTGGTVSPSPAGAYGQGDATDPSNWGGATDRPDPRPPVLPGGPAYGPPSLSGGGGAGSRRGA